MRKFGTRFLSLFIAVLMVFSLLPTSTMAVSPVLSENRTWNSLYYNQSFKFWERYDNGSHNWFLFPFDAASGSVMFCVDPGKSPASDLSA